MWSVFYRDIFTEIVFCGVSCTVVIRNINYDVGVVLELDDGLNNSPVPL